MDTWALVVEGLKYLLLFVPLGLVPVMIFLERKGAAVIQDRPGPNRAAIAIGPLRIRGFGFVHNFTDMIKLLFKEDFIPARAHKFFYILAPAIPVGTALLTPAVLPWFGGMEWLAEGGEVVRVSGALVADHAGLLLLFALGSLSVYGVVLGSWASNSKFSLLGGLRASAMMISYEVAMGLSVLGLILCTGTFSLIGIVEWQAEHTWGAIVQPVGFLLFLVCMFAETGRTPFDVAEGDSEIVAGFHTEYSSFKFALFFMGEYAHIVIASALLATLFLGGWSLLPLPGFGADFIIGHLPVVLACLLLIGAAAVLFIARLVSRQRRRYAQLRASDIASKSLEYQIYIVALTLLGLGLMGAAAAALWLLPDPQLVDGFYPRWAVLAAAPVMVGIVLAKTLFFCWLFVWVRWTLPRLRYDQIMSLGWKVMFNIALVNLLVTAVIIQVLRG